MDYLKEEQVARVASDTKGHRIFWFIFLGVIFVILFLIVYLAFIVNNKNISDTKLMEGVALEVGENDAVKFNLNEQEHGMKINFVGYDSVEVTISSDPINLTLNINEVKEIDLDNDDFYDLRIKLISIVNGKATIAIQKIERDSCQESWDCSQWSDCSDNKQKRDCDDENDCGTTFYKPSEERNCLEIEFVEDYSAFGNVTNNVTNISLNNTSNFTFNNSNFSTNTTINNTSIMNTSILNCGSTQDYSCFINASKTCRPAKWALTQEMNLFGVLSYSTKYFEIKGYSSEGKCIYYEKYLSGGIEYTDALVSSLMQQGYTPDQIDEMEESTREDFSYSIGQEKICRFNRADLTELLIRWKEGSFSTSDYDNTECYPHSTFDCKLDFVDNMVISGISISSMDSALQSIIISVKGFSDSSKIVWSVENSSVIRLYPLTGNYSKIYPLKVGKTVIVIKDTSLSSCELRTPFEVFGDYSYDTPVCDNDSRCEWEEGEDITNCPHDCIGDSSFFSNYFCESHEDCYLYEEYPFCVLNICSKPTKALKDFIYQNYPTTNCSAIPCYYCQSGTYHPVVIDYYYFELEFCAECSKESSIFPCKPGFICEKGRCIYYQTYYNTGTYPNTTDSSGDSNLDGTY